MTTGPWSVAFPALGTTALVVVDRERSVGRARDLLAQTLDIVDRACSRFRPDSELVALNARAGRETTVGSTLGAAIDAALRAAEQTGGAVDPTVGPAVIALGYDRDFAALPADGDAVRGVPAAGWTSVGWDPRVRRVCVPLGSALDLGATAKAWAADVAAARIHRETGASVLVSLGGDIATAGQVPVDGWPVRVCDDHRGAPDENGQTIALHGGGLATSSITVRAWRRGGRTVHHIVDPRTGEPADPMWRTVSVVAASALDANAASTAAIVRGRDAPAWLRALGLPARLVGIQGDVKTIGAWPEPA